MSREIKFRTWCVNNGEWEPDLILIDGFGSIFQLHEKLVPCKPSTHIIQQFTGLKDRNGKEIYEGDILKYHDSVAFEDSDPDGNLTLAVMWSEQDLAWRTDNDLLCDVEEPEIIGNIWESPKLLEATKC